MPNRISNSPIHTDNYNHWGLITNNMQCKNVVRQANGRLWAAVATSTFQIYLYTSTDDGFSWDIVRRDAGDGSTNLRAVASLNADGPFVHIVISEAWDILDVWYTDYENIGFTHDILCGRWILSDLIASGEDATAAVYQTGEAAGIVEEEVVQGQFDVCGNDHETYCFYDVGDKIRVRRKSPRSNACSAAVEFADTPIFNTFSTTINEDSTAYLLYMHQTGGENIVKCVTYSESAGFGSGVTIQNFAETDTEARDPSVALDSYGTICAIYSALNTATNAVQPRYAISKDSGATWAVVGLTRTSGHTAFVDSVTTDPGARTQVIGAADGGFMICYTETHNSVARTFTRRITTSDGATYTLGDEEELGTSNTKSTDKIVGAHFFLPTPHSRLMDFRDPGLVRVAYTVGEGNSTTGADQTPVTFGQELLFSSAYPNILTEETTLYTMESADYRSVLVTLEVLGGLDENIDYYTYGVTGNFTDRYMAAFKRIGNSIRLVSYEPDQDNYMSDRSAYGDPTSTTKKCILSPESYSYPVPDVTSSDHTSWIEQDIRTLYLPPDQHISRTFLINSGGFLKRTVWLCYFDSNEYEISQVIPHFIDNQICYYECNAYVVGPSRNPFSRTVLPSET